MRGKGLGKFMMKVGVFGVVIIVTMMTQVLELLMMKAGLLKIMLTVFKHNTNAVTFFKQVKLVFSSK